MVNASASKGLANHRKSLPVGRIQGGDIRRSGTAVFWCLCQHVAARSRWAVAVMCRQRIVRRKQDLFASSAATREDRLLRQHAPLVSYSATSRGESLPASHRSGVTVICLSAAIRSSRGGCVLNNELKVPEPNSGFTMQRAEVLGEMAVVGIRLL